MKKIIIAIDSFKGCLTSAEAGKAAEKAMKDLGKDANEENLVKFFFKEVYKN